MGAAVQAGITHARPASSTLVTLARGIGDSLHVTGNRAARQRRVGRRPGKPRPVPEDCRSGGCFTPLARRSVGARSMAGATPAAPARRTNTAPQTASRIRAGDTGHRQAIGARPGFRRKT